MGFRINPSDRVSIVGKTGSGKSVFAKRLLRAMALQAEQLPFYYPVIVVDMKGSPRTFRGFGKRVKYMKDLKNALRQSLPVITYSVHESEQTRGHVEGLFKWLYELNEPMLVYVDELTLVAKGNDIPEYLERFYKQGRERMQSLWAGTQSPVFVPHDFLANADHYFVFDLNIEDDRKKMGKIAGIAGRPDDVHGFWYFSVSARDPVYFQNELPPAQRKDAENIIQSEEKEEKGMNKKWVVGLLVLAFLMTLLIPVWKKVFAVIGSKVPALAPVANYAQEA